MQTTHSNAVRLRLRVHRMLEVSDSHDSRFSKALDIALIVLIATNVVAVILETVDSLHQAYLPWFTWLEIISVIVFTIEYLLRIWSCVEKSSSEEGNAPSNLVLRLRYSLTPMALIDLVAILPFYLSVLFTIDLRFLRVLRLLRVFKLTRYSSAMTILLSVLQRKASALLATFFILVITLIMTASCMYLVEQGNLETEAFSSIPNAMWWAVVTLTTVGYGDVVPATVYGKILGSVISVIGVGIVALPTGILASGFAEQLQRHRSELERHLQDALADGVIDDDEARNLALISDKLGISPDDLHNLVREKSGNVASASSSTPAETCPHCHKPLT